MISLSTISWASPHRGGHFSFFENDIRSKIVLVLLGLQSSVFKKAEKLDYYFSFYFFEKEKKKIKFILFNNVARSSEIFVANGALGRVEGSKDASFGGGKLVVA